MTEFWIAVATLIGTILIFIQNQKVTNSNYLKDDAQNRRQQLQKIVLDLYKYKGELRGIRDKKTLLHLLNKLKLFLNPNGKRVRFRGDYKYSVDGHIWRVIYQLEKIDLNTYLEKLIDYLEILIKFEWEKDKNRMRYNIFQTFVLFSILVEMVLLILWIIQPTYFTLSENATITSPGFLIILSLISFFIYFLCIRKKFFILISNAFLLIIFLICLFLPYWSLLYRYNDTLVIVLKKTSILSDVIEDKLTWILFCAAFFFEIIFLLLSIDNELLDYYKNINNVDCLNIKKQVSNIYFLLGLRPSLKNSNKYLAYFYKITKIDEQYGFISGDLNDLIDSLDNDYNWKKSPYKREIKYLIKYRKKREISIGLIFSKIMAFRQYKDYVKATISYLLRPLKKIHIKIIDFWEMIK